MNNVVVEQEEPNSKNLEIRDLALSQAHNLNFRIKKNYCRKEPFHGRVKNRRIKEKNRRMENRRKR